MTVRRVPVDKMLSRLVAARPSGASVTTTRRFATAVSNDTSGRSGKYVSPFQDIFDAIKAGKTSIGTSEFSAPEIKYLRCGIPENVLKFKTTSYGRLLEEPHVMPNEHRVTLQIETQHIPMTEIERAVLKQIVGSRLDDKKGMLHLTSSQFGSRIENKRHAVSMLDRIVESTRDLAAKVEAEALGNESA